MDQKKLLQAKNALQSIAKHEGISIEEVKKEITNAILIGMQNHNPKVQNYWRNVPKERNVPAPEELIAFLADDVKNA